VVSDEQVLTPHKQIMKKLNELEQIEFEIEKEKQNLREWKRKVLILEIGKQDDETRTDAILEKISELLERKEKLKK
jgi:tRNA(Ser,Leu) C12 N-acetylase TAN1